MRRRVKTFDAFHESRSALDPSPETVAAFELLLRRVLNKPESEPPIPGSRIRVMRTITRGAFPALRIFYAIDDTTISLLHVERYDELA